MMSLTSNLLCTDSNLEFLSLIPRDCNYDWAWKLLAKCFLKLRAFLRSDSTSWFLTGLYGEGWMGRWTPEWRCPIYYGFWLYIVFYCPQYYKVLVWKKKRLLKDLFYTKFYIIMGKVRVCDKDQSYSIFFPFIKSFIFEDQVSEFSKPFLPDW